MAALSPEPLSFHLLDVETAVNHWAVCNRMPGGGLVKCRGIAPGGLLPGLLFEMISLVQWKSCVVVVCIWQGKGAQGCHLNT